MKSISAFVVVAASLFGASDATLVADTLEGCFSSTTGMSLLSTLKIVDPSYDRNFNSKGSCGGACRIGSYATYAMEDKDCYCGQKLPPAVTESNSTTDCNLQCPGYQTDGCGGAGFYSVYVTGLTSSVSNAAPASSDTPTHSSATPTSSAPASKTTLPNSTIVVTASPSSTAGSDTGSKSKSSGPSTVGIAVGVVVGLIVVAAIAGGLWFFFRNKKRQELEEEHRRQAAVSQFINGGKPPGSAGSSNDTRLDPSVMAQRRMSDGSIADNQDYSRRILKVTNA